MKISYHFFFLSIFAFLFFVPFNVVFSQEVDTIPPVVTLIDSSLIIIPCHGEYVEFGANAVDNVDGILDVEIVSECVCTDYAGSYVVEYKAIDSSGNVGGESRLVIVQGDCEDYCPPSCQPDIAPVPLIVLNDSAYTQVNTPLTIYVLDNDDGINMKIIEVLDGTNFGIATIVEERRINYIPKNDFLGLDSFQYKVKSVQDWTVGNIIFIDTATVFIEVGTTSIQTTPSYPSLQVYPNPVKDVLNIELGKGLAAKQNLQFLLFNTVGQLQLIHPISNTGTSKLDIAVEGLQKGLYLFQLKATKGEILTYGKLWIE